MQKSKKKRILELLITPDMALDAIALVESPAIEENFIAFSKGEHYVFARMDQEQRLATGPAMIPDKLIPRLDQETGEMYDVFFSRSTVEDVSRSFLIHQKQRSVNLEHETPVQMVSVVESWIISDENMDKAKALGYELPAGTWMVSMKINNDEVWNLVKQGAVKGFSIEGYFINQAIQNNKTIMTKEKFATATAADGTVIYYADGSELAAGTPVFSDEAMTTPLADGDYPLEDGSTISVASGSVSDVKPAEAAPTAQAEAPATPAATAPAAPDTRIDQFGAAIDDLTQRVMKLEDALAKNAPAEDAEMKSVKEQLATALTKLKALTDKELPKSITLNSDEKKAMTLEEKAKMMRELVR
jgi:hypothetical protein